MESKDKKIQMDKLQRTFSGQIADLNAEIDRLLKESSDKDVNIRRLKKLAQDLDDKISASEQTYTDNLNQKHREISRLNNLHREIRISLLRLRNWRRKMTPLKRT